MITIDQLLESVDLDFEPRWVTKDRDGTININAEKPESGVWVWCDGGESITFGKTKLAEFENKPWQECIYEVPRKTTGKIEKLPTSAPFGCQSAGTLCGTKELWQALIQAKQDLEIARKALKWLGNNRLAENPVRVEQLRRYADKALEQIEHKENQ